MKQTIHTFNQSTTFVPLKGNIPKVKIAKLIYDALTPLYTGLDVRYRTLFASQWKVGGCLKVSDTCRVAGVLSLTPQATLSLLLHQNPLQLLHADSQQ